MPTQQLFLSDVASDNGGSGERQLSEFRGYKSATHVTATTASGTSIQETLTSGGTAVVYLSRVYAAGTAITGNMTGNLRGLESSTSVNAGLGGVLEVVDATNSTVLATLLSETGFPASITELTTSDAAKALASTAVTSYTPSVPYRLRWTTKVKNAGGTMAAGTVTTSVNGPSASAAGDSSVTLPVTSTPYWDPAKPYVAASGAANATNGSGYNSCSPAVPSGVASGSLILLKYGAYWTASGLTPSTSDFTLPSGFVDSGFGLSSFTDTIDGFTFTTGWAYKYATGADSGTYALSWSSTVSGNSTDGGYGKAFLIGNGPTSGNPFDTVQFGSSGSGTSASISTFTPGSNNCLLLLWQYAYTNNQRQPDGFIPNSVETGLAGFNFNAVTSYRQQGTATATGSLTVTTDQTSWITESLAVIKAVASAFTGSATSTLTITTSTAGVVGASTGATSTLTITSATAGSTGISTTLASSTITVTSSASGAGSGAANPPTLTITGTAAGVVGKSSGATSTLTITGATAGVGQVSGTLATSTLTFTSTAAGTEADTVMSTLTITGSAAGNVATGSGATSTLTITSTAAGVANASTGATSTLTITSAAAGGTQGAAFSTITITGTAAGVVALFGAVTSTLTITASVSSNPIGSVSSTLLLTITAAGVVNKSTGATSTLTITGTVAGAAGKSTGATSTLTITGTVTGSTAELDSVISNIVITSTAAGSTGRASGATSTLTIVGSAGGAGAGAVTSTILGTLHAAGTLGTQTGGTSTLVITATAAGAVSSGGNISSVLVITGTATGHVTNPTTGLPVIGSDSGYIPPGITSQISPLLTVTAG